MTTTISRNHGVHDATIHHEGYGLEVDLLLRRQGAAVIGGIPNRRASTHSLQYRDVPVGGALDGAAGDAAMIQGF